MVPIKTILILHEQPGRVGSSELRSSSLAKSLFPSLNVFRSDVASIGDRVENHTLLGNPNVVDGLCQAKLHVSFGQVVDPRCVGCYFWEWGAEKRKSPSPSLTRREISRSVIEFPWRITITTSRLSFPLCSGSLFRSYSFVTAWMQGCCREPEQACVLGQVSSKTKKRKKIDPASSFCPHNIPCPPSHSTFLLARATAVVLALTPR